MSNQIKARVYNADLTVLKSWHATDSPDGSMEIYDEKHGFVFALKMGPEPSVEIYKLEAPETKGVEGNFGTTLLSATIRPQ